MAGRRPCSRKANCVARVKRTISCPIDQPRRRDLWISYPPNILMDVLWRWQLVARGLFSLWDSYNSNRCFSLERTMMHLHSRSTFDHVWTLTPRLKAIIVRGFPLEVLLPFQWRIVGLLRRTFSLWNVVRAYCITISKTALYLSQLDRALVGTPHFPENCTTLRPLALACRVLLVLLLQQTMVPYNTKATAHNSKKRSFANAQALELLKKTCSFCCWFDLLTTLTIMKFSMIALVFLLGNAGK